MFLSGAKRGRDFTVIANRSNTLSIDLKGDNLNGVIEGNRIKVLPHWNLVTAFPAGRGAEISPNILDIRSQILSSETEATGINFASHGSFYNDAGSWQKFGGGSKVRAPHRYMMVRNKSVATSPVFVGVFPSDFQAVPLRLPKEDDKQANHVAHNWPIPLSLRDSNLI